MLLVLTEQTDRLSDMHGGRPEGIGGLQKGSKGRTTGKEAEVPGLLPHRNELASHNCSTAMSL